MIERRPGQVRDWRGRLLAEFLGVDTGLTTHEELMVRVLYWHLEGWSLSAIGDALGLSRERVRQIEAEARRRVTVAHVREEPTGP